MSTPLAIGAVAALAAAAEFSKRGSGATHLDDWDRSSLEGWVNQVAALIQAGDVSAARSLAAEGGWNPSNPIPMGGTDLSDLHIEYEDLSFLDLTGVLLARSDLTGCTLPQKMAGTDLTDSILTRVNAKSVDFSDAYLADADFSDSSLERSIFDSAVLHEACFRRSDLQGANLAGADLMGADFSESNLENAKLTNAHLNGSTFHGAHLKDANLNNSSFFCDASGIKSGANREWVGLPVGYSILRSRLSGKEYGIIKLTGD